jgi:two-component sensor histidine kinase
MEEELNKHREHLEELVEVRTAELNKINKQLKKEITDRKQAEEQIKTSLNEKEVLLQEVHHRVKNNMQIISSLLKLQSKHVKDKKVLELFKSTQSRVQSMAVIHERLYRSKDFARVDFTEYVQILVNHLFSSYGIDPKTIKLHVHIKDVLLDINAAIPCGLIINELISNSLKYAFPGNRKGEIEIVMHLLNKNEMELIVSDNGIGLPKDVDYRNTESLGLHLVAILAEDQLHGEIKLDRTKGTSFQLRLRVKQ